MPGLVPSFHVFKVEISKDVDGRDEPGHDEGRPWKPPHQTNASTS
jgi:hypothetical protein